MFAVYCDDPAGLRRRELLEIFASEEAAFTYAQGSHERGVAVAFVGPPPYVPSVDEAHRTADRAELELATLE
jgi:hypothetical protein